MTTQGGIPGGRDGRTTSMRDVLAGSEGVEYGRGWFNPTYCYDGGNTDYERQLRQGIVLGRATASGKWMPCKRSLVNAASPFVGPKTALIVDDARHFQVNDTITIRGRERIGKMTDLDAASSTGVAVYVHMDEKAEGGMQLGHLESVTAGNANTYWDIGASGPRLRVLDDDAASTGGFQLFYDEDATNPDERFLANNSVSGQDMFLQLSDGRYLRVKHHATPSTPGVAVYCDDDAATVSERMLFVSPTNADGYFLTDDSFYDRSPGWVSRATAVAVTAVNYSTNTLTIASTIVADGDDVYADQAAVAGAEKPRLILNQWCNLLDEDGVLLTGASFGRGLSAGPVRYAQILGDLACLRGLELGVDSFLHNIRWDDYAGQT